MSTLGRILLVEDDPNDVELTLTALEEDRLANEIVVAMSVRGRVSFPTQAETILVKHSGARVANGDKPAG